MSKVSANMSMSLDGFITGPNDGVEFPLGVGGERVHQWVYGLGSWRERQGMEGGTRNVDADILDEAFRNTGAFVMGRRMFDAGEVPWGDNPPFRMPVFVVTHDAREKLVKEGGTTFTFVTDGIESALEQASAAAGGRDVSVSGGANIVQQFIKAGLLDELQIHMPLSCSATAGASSIGSALADRTGAYTGGRFPRSHAYPLPRREVGDLSVYWASVASYDRNRLKFGEERSFPNTLGVDRWQLTSL